MGCGIEMKFRDKVGSERKSDLKNQRASSEEKEAVVAPSTGKRSPVRSGESTYIL
jgi:hypothetical protein